MKRYDIYITPAEDLASEESEDGEWVQWEDVRALLAERERVRKLVDDKCHEYDLMRERGKGTWPGPNYVTDEEWARLGGKLHAWEEMRAALERMKAEG